MDDIGFSLERRAAQSDYEPRHQPAHQDTLIIHREYLVQSIPEEMDSLNMNRTVYF